MTRYVRALCAAAVATAAFPAAASALPMLKFVEAQRGPTADRLVFTFSGGLPSQVRQREVATVTQDASGTPLTVQGSKFREVVFMMANAHTDAGKPTCAPGILTPNLELLVQARMAGDFEGVITYGIGLRRQVAARVVRQPGAKRIVLVFPR